MKYSFFEQLTLAVGAIAIVGTIVAGAQQGLILEEVVAQVLIFIVLVGAVHWGRNGGFVTAVGATLIYILLRIPLLVDEGLTEDTLTMILIRTLTYGIVGILGGELCSRVKYIFASMEDADSLDHVTRLFNERFIGTRFKKVLSEHERYGTLASVIVLRLDPALYLPLRKAKQRTVLRSVASHVRNDVRLVDDVGRLQDGRFLLVLPNTPREGAEVAAARVRDGVRNVLSAREESVEVEVMGAPDDLEKMTALLDTLSLGESDAPAPDAPDRRLPAQSAP